MADVSDKVKNLIKEFKNVRNEHHADAETIFGKALAACTDPKEAQYCKGSTYSNKLQALAQTKKAALL